VVMLGGIQLKFVEYFLFCSEDELRVMPFPLIVSRCSHGLYFCNTLGSLLMYY
jgi:hypothetical protein